MALRQTKKISELPALTPATLDTTFVVGISGSTTYKISINQLTSSLDSAFATDLVTTALSGTLDGKLSTSSFNSYTASISTGSLVTSISNLNIFTASVTTASIVTSISNLNTFTASVSTASLVTSIDNLNTFTASQSTSSLVNRLNAIESVSGSWITESETGSFLTSLNGAISSSTQISDLGFVTGSYTTINSFNNLTQSFNSISQSFNVISGSVGTVDFSGVVSSSAQITAFGFISSSQTINTSSFATTGSNIFNGNQSISGSLLVTDIIQGTGSIYLRPDQSDGRYFEIYNTAAADTHIKSNQGLSFFGDDTNYLSINDSAETVTITGSNGVYVGGIVETIGAFSQSVDSRLSNLQSTSASLVTSISNLNQFTASVSTASLVTSITNINNATSSYELKGSGILSGSISYISLTNIPQGIVSQSTDLSSLNTFTASISTASLVNRLNAIESVSGSWITESETGSLQTSITNLNTFTASISTASLVTSISNLNSATSSYLTSLSGAISSSSQLTSSYDTRYALSASFVSSSNVVSIQTITSASYAALTPVSGTLYIIIG